MSASAAVLETRLRQVLALEPDEPFSQKSARDAIVSEQLYQCVCARIPPVDGKSATFAQYYMVLYGVTVDGKPWKPKERRQAG